MKGVVAAASMVLMLGAFAAAVPQERQGDRGLILRSETNLVMLPVTVLDRHRSFVAGLTEKNFAIFDNGESQTIQFFTNEDIPATVGLVIDCSGSMRALRAQVTAAGTAFAESSHPLDEMFTVNFNDSVWPGLPPGVKFAKTPVQLRAALERAPAVGRTALYDAVQLALDRVNLGTRDRKVLIVVSDGGDNASTANLDSVLASAKKGNVVIHSVALVDPDDPDARPRVLKQLASLTGGSFSSPDRVDEVMKAFTRIAQEIRSGYTLGFSPPEAGRGFRTLKVVARGPDGHSLQVRTRAGYFAGAQ